MKPTKQTAYLPVNNEQSEFYLSDSSVTGVVKKEGYFFTPEQLNEYTQSVIKQSLETSAEKVDRILQMNYTLNKESITNTFEETFKKFVVWNI